MAHSTQTSTSENGDTIPSISAFDEKKNFINSQLDELDNEYDELMKSKYTKMDELGKNQHDYNWVLQREKELREQELPDIERAFNETMNYLIQIEEKFNEARKNKHSDYEKLIKWARALENIVKRAENQKAEKNNILKEIKELEKEKDTLLNARPKIEKEIADINQKIIDNDVEHARLVDILGAIELLESGVTEIDLLAIELSEGLELQEQGRAFSFS